MNPEYGYLFKLLLIGDSSGRQSPAVAIVVHTALVTYKQCMWVPVLVVCLLRHLASEGQNRLGGPAAMGGNCACPVLALPLVQAITQEELGEELNELLCEVRSSCKWDTGGQERFRMITGSYYGGVHGIIICNAKLTVEISRGKFRETASGTHLEKTGSSTGAVFLPHGPQGLSLSGFSLRDSHGMNESEFAEVSMILGTGDLSNKLIIKDGSLSASGKDKLEAVGCTITISPHQYTLVN
ncbi:hypothetical protein C5167_021445 [Papaver somniferum]|nr:hypothetical protein C5167_021445 [Papaver somniferum]